jgi:hypothetical protein
MEIDEQTQEKYSEGAIVSHCLFEMTFYGYSHEEVQNVRAELMQQITK